MEETVVRFVTESGLVALLILMVLDNIGVPFPSEIPLLFAGFLVRQGDLALIPAVVVAGLGSLIGALILFGLARTIGRAVVTRWGRIIRVDEDDLERAEAWFHRRGELSVLYLRVVPLVRTIISIPAGIFEMNATRFAAYTFAGALAWSGIVVGIGWGLGASYERVLGGFGLAGFAVASTIGMVLVIWFVNRLRRRGTPSTPTE